MRKLNPADIEIPDMRYLRAVFPKEVVRASKKQLIIVDEAMFSVALDEMLNIL